MTVTPCLIWRKSSWSTDGDCLEAAVMSGVVLVRDSKDRAGVLTFAPGGWRRLLANLPVNAADDR